MINMKNGFINSLRDETMRIYNNQGIIFCIIVSELTTT